MLSVFNSIIGLIFVGLLIPPCYIYIAGLTVELIDMSSERRKEFALELFESLLLGIAVPALFLGGLVGLSYIILIPFGGV
jgi:hypothetical protein